MPHQNWQSLGAGGLYGAISYGNGGGTSGGVARDGLDASRLGAGRIPSAEYPDGYLGTINNRRADRLLDSLKSRQNQRSYQRGVHKGERIDPGDYLWPNALQPDRGIRNEANGMKTGPMMELAPRPHLVNDGKANTTANTPAEINPVRGAQLRKLMPVWR